MLSTRQNITRNPDNAVFVVVVEKIGESVLSNEKLGVRSVNMTGSR